MTFLLALAAATAALAGPAQWTHTTAVAHGNGQATATYTARPHITTRQIGMSGGTRMSTERCIWIADISVDRRLAPAGGDTMGLRDMASIKTLKGSRPGACANSRRVIDREIAAKTPDIKAHLMAVAERDQRELRTEIEALAPTGR